MGIRATDFIPHLHKSLSKNLLSFHISLLNEFNNSSISSIVSGIYNASLYVFLYLSNHSIRFLSMQKPVPKLIYNEHLSKAARDHALDMAENNLLGHEGSNGSILSDRIEKYIEWDDSCAESIDLGFKTADNIILNLLIDDGSKGRNQRINLFSTQYKYIGIGCSFHKTYNHCSVFVYAKSLRDLGQPPNVAINFMQDYIQKTFYKRYVVNKFQEDDPDAPDDTIDVRIAKCQKTVGGKEKKITKKIYTLKDQSLHIMEIEEN